MFCILVESSGTVIAEGLKILGVERERGAKMQIRRVVKQGGSLLVVLPKRYSNAMGLRAGDYVRFTWKGKTMEVSRNDSAAERAGE